jgi:hypothetical protein
MAQDFRQRFKFGRITRETCEDSVNKMPLPEMGCEGELGLRGVFINNIYHHFDEKTAWRLTAAISGAHTLGGADAARSGYHGYWGDRKTTGIFDNDYYVSMLAKGWGPYHMVQEGKPDKNEWIRVDAGHDPYTSHLQMMLDSDLCLAYRSNDPQPKQILAKDTNCCMWVDPKLLFKEGEEGMFCGMPYANTMSTPSFASKMGKMQCCGYSEMMGELPDCNDIRRPNGYAYEAVLDFATNQKHFLEAFKQAWWIATENGYYNLKPLYTQSTMPDPMDGMEMGHDMGHGMEMGHGMDMMTH